MEYLKNKTSCKTILLIELQIALEIQRNLDFHKDILSWSVDNEVDGFGITKDALVMRTPDNHVEKVKRNFIDDVHSMGKKVHVYTFRNE